MTGGGIRFRAARPGDGDGIVAVVRACDESYRDWTPDGWEPPADEARERLRWAERLKDGAHHTEVAVDTDGTVVGLVSWAQALEMALPPRPVPGLAHVSAMFVHPRRWREGIASRLLERAERAMAAAGFERAELWTPEEAPARRFYEARGWEPDGRRQWFEDLRLPIVGYEKALRRA